jgi:hypothetical protein
MDDPQVPKRLDEAITMVGTCMDMCPRFERYRRERENNLFNWEVVRLFSFTWIPKKLSLRSPRFPERSAWTISAP